MPLTGDQALGRHIAVLKDTWAQVAQALSGIESWCLEMVFRGSQAYGLQSWFTFEL